MAPPVDSVAPSPPAPGMRAAPVPREDGPLVETVGTTCSSPPAPGMRASPDLREDGRLPAAVGSSPPAPGMLVAPDPGEDDCMIAAVVSPPRAPGVPGTPGPRANDTSRNFPRASSLTSCFEATTMSGSGSQDVRVALRCGYGNTGPSRTTRALRSRSSRKTSRNLPLRTNIEDDRSVLSSDFHPDQSVAAYSSWTLGVSPEATELVENKCPRQGDTCLPQGLTTATLLVPKCAPSYPDELRRGDLRGQIPRAARAVLTTPFAVDAL